MSYKSFADAADTRCEECEPETAWVTQNQGRYVADDNHGIKIMFDRVDAGFAINEAQAKELVSKLSNPTEEEEGSIYDEAEDFSVRRNGRVMVDIRLGTTFVTVGVNDVTQLIETLTRFLAKENDDTALSSKSS
jgi:hypothetical protein